MYTYSSNKPKKILLWGITTFYFYYLKSWLEAQCINNNELIVGAKTWLSLQVADLFGTSIQELTSQYDKCLSSDCDYVEK